MRYAISDVTAVPGAYLVLSPRIELGIHPYQGCGMPFTYESELVARDRIELPSLLCKSKALPLDERAIFGQAYEN